MSENTGYHIWKLSGDKRTWTMLESVPRHLPGDDMAFPSEGHFLGRSGATEYVRRNLKGRTVMVKQCTWPNCAFRHLPEFLAGRPPDEVAAVQESRRLEAKAKRQRRAERDRRHKQAFEAAVAAEVALRLAALDIEHPPVQMHTPVAAASVR